MSALPILLLCAVLVAIFGLYAYVPQMRELVRIHSGLLDLLNAVAALSVFASLYYTLQQYHASKREQKSQQFSVLKQSLDALSLELEMNLQVCDHFLQEFESGSTPYNLFHTEILGHVLRVSLIDDTALQELDPPPLSDGSEITARKMGVTLNNVQHWTFQANDTLKRLADLMILQAVSARTPETQGLLSTRIKEFMGFAKSDVEKIKPTVKGLLPVIEQLRKDAARLAKREGKVKP